MYEIISKFNRHSRV